ncbi:MAG: AAA family ATPase [Victivallales bacterium]|nr:AAA family ATPase [Victivallales bacterium]
MIPQLTAVLQGGAPLVYIHSPEEERVLRGLRHIAEQEGRPLRTWSCLAGLQGEGEDTRDAATAILAALRKPQREIIVFLDLSPFLNDPRTIRALREAYAASKAVDGRVLILLCADLVLPETLQKEIQLVDIPTPGEAEIAALIDNALSTHPEYAIPPDVVREVTMALKGLTENEVTYVLARAFRLPNATKEQLLDEIFAEKKAIVKKTGFLEFSPPRWSIEGLGGLDNLKQWLIRRKHTFTREALEAGVPIPKGLLMMGVSGCGKSLAVKTISSLWNLPMFRLDMNLVFSGMYGSPEAAFHNALKTIEAVSPAVLWVDEIENALGMDDSGQRISSHIFSSFLTWMQEKPPLIFIAATANKIQAIPAEVLRKGRFDEVFFCDLPAAPEREEILRIHLVRNGADPKDFDFKMLNVMTEGWNGAEIEQAVISARTEAFYDHRMFTQKDLSQVIGRIVPLSDTMEQQIKAIRSWAFSRATPASKYGKSAARAR